jgi:drug/metabolite transporter (DMT)-like permease
VLEGTVWGMAWGAATAAAIATATGVPWAFDPRPAYMLALLYLAVCGSIVAFVAYFTLIKEVGTGPAAYVSVATPAVAVLLSTLFVGYAWTWPAALGVALAVAGNYVALRRDAD